MDLFRYVKKNKADIYTKVNRMIVPVLIFLILFAPVALKSIKIVIIGIVIASLGLIVSRNIYKVLDKRVIKWVLIYSFTNLFFLARGNWNNFPVFKQLFPTNVLWPILYLIILIVPLSNYVNLNLTKTFKRSLLSVEIFLFYVYLSFIGVLPRLFFFELPLGQSINMDLGFVDFFSPSITSLFFLVPFFVSTLIIRKFEKGQLYHIVGLVLFGLIISLITGRRTLIALIFASPVITFAILKLISNVRINIDLSKIKKILPLIIVFSAFLFLMLNYSGISLRINNLENELIRSGTSIRTEQFVSLMNGWLESPLLGAGLGVNADVIRSEFVPGAYELTYVARLFQTGVVGLAIYIYQIYWIIKKLFRISAKYPHKREFVIPTLTGFLCLLIAEFTNPYLSSFDGMWIIFYALAIVNHVLVKEEQNDKTNTLE